VGTLYYVSSKVEEELKASVDENIDRYLGNGFTDLAIGEGWSIPISIQCDLEALRQLRQGESPEAEVLNSLVVWKALSRLTPALANEGRIWTRLAHVECFEFSRDRWMRGKRGTAAVKAARIHFFGDTRTRRRDDNAIGRLWWNAYIARQSMPSNHHEGLKALLQNSDIRSNIVERARTGRIPSLAGGLLRVVAHKPEVAANAKRFRDFMKNVNRLGGGILFELMEPEEIDQWLERCIPLPDRKSA
jgi:hypothetical protein